MSTTGREAEPRGSDHALIRRMVEGDEAALAALYDRYSGVVYSVASRILREAGAAEEVLQDIFYQLWRTASHFDLTRGSLPGWLLVMARNRAIDRLRRRHRSAAEGAQCDPVATAPSLEAAAARSEMMSRVRSVVEGMPAAQRQALELAYFEGLTHTEIAARTREPLGTIKTRLRSALQELKKALSR